jgi:hypothetical protein
MLELGWKLVSLFPSPKRESSFGHRRGATSKQGEADFGDGKAPGIQR